MSDPIKIEHGIPFPQKSVYPFKAMEVGDSFFVPNPKKSIRAMASIAGTRHGRKFLVRSIEGGVRVWRVA